MLSWLSSGSLLRSTHVQEKDNLRYIVGSQHFQKELEDIPSFLGSELHGMHTAS